MLLIITASAPGRAEERAEAKSRDASAAFVATQNFIVARFGRDCLTDLGRHETPREYMEKWQHENAKYYDAASKYMEVRLRQIDDRVERDGVERAYYASVQQKGEAAVAEWFNKGAKGDICKYALTLIDSGRMNVDEIAKAAKHSVMDDLTALVAWAKKP